MSGMSLGEPRHAADRQLDPALCCWRPTSGLRLVLTAVHASDRDRLPPSTARQARIRSTERPLSRWGILTVAG